MFSFIFLKSEISTHLKCRKTHTLPLLATGIPIPPGITSPRHQRRVSRSPRSHESTAMWWIRCISPQPKLLGRCWRCSNTYVHVTSSSLEEVMPPCHLWWQLKVYDSLWSSTVDKNQMSGYPWLSLHSEESDNILVRGGEVEVSTMSLLGRGLCLCPCIGPFQWFEMWSFNRTWSYIAGHCRCQQYSAEEHLFYNYARADMCCFHKHVRFADKCVCAKWIANSDSLGFG